MRSNPRTQILSTLGIVGFYFKVIIDPPATIWKKMNLNY